MDHLSSCIQILSFSCKSNTSKLHLRTFSFQNAHRIQIRGVRTEGTGNPFDRTAFFYLARFVFRLYIFFDQFSMVE